MVHTSRSAARSTQRGRVAEPFSRTADSVSIRGRGQEIATRPASVENSSPPPRAAESTPAEAAASGMKRLMEAMNSLGMNTAGLDINYTEEAVAYPGGQYVNRLINVTAGGKTEHFSAELTAKNPLITAYELQRYFGVAGNASGASGSGTQA